MRRVLYVFLFSCLGAMAGFLLTLTAEIVSLFAIGFFTTQSTIDLGGWFLYARVALFAIGLCVGLFEGLRMWDRLYGDRIAVRNHRYRFITFLVYGLLFISVVALGYSSNVFGLKEMMSRSGGSLTLQTQAVNSVSDGILYGVVLLDTGCEVVGREGTVTRSATASACSSRPYQTTFGLFLDGRVVKVVESSENGTFEIVLPPNDYYIGVLPGSNERLVAEGALVTVQPSKKIRIEIRYVSGR